MAKAIWIRKPRRLRLKEKAELERDSDDRWRNDYPDYKVVAHPLDKRLQIVIEKAKGNVRVLGLYLRTLVKEHAEGEKILEAGEGVVHHDNIYKFQPFSEETSGQLAEILMKRDAELKIKKEPKYETMPHPEKSRTTLLLVKRPGRLIALLGSHIKTLPNTPKNLREAMKLKKQRRGLDFHKTLAEIHVFKPFSKEEHKTLARFVKETRK